LAEYTPRILAGRYEVGDLIGRGGMAEVHVGKDTRLGRTVAIKLLRSDLSKDPAFQTRFRREAQAAASLNHPAIVSVYDTGEHVTTDPSGNSHHWPFIIMEYVEGHTLRELMRDGAALPIDEATDITMGVLSALQYAHHAGIVHRDIKPANIMLTVTGQVKVMDFGIARALTETAETITQNQAVIGTAQYLSPEQARGETVDARSDLYSTGCVLYELLTGAPPFVGDSAVAVAYQHVRENPVTPSIKAPDVPPIYDRIVMKALAKDRNQRYSTASEFLADLEAAKQGRTVSAPPVTPAAAATQVLAPAAFEAAVPVAAQTPAAGFTGILPDQEQLDDEEAARKKKKIIIFSVVGGVLVVVLALLAFFLLRSPSEPDEPDIVMVTVPAVPASGTEEDARQALIDVDLVPVRDEEGSETVELGKVTRYDPETGEEVEKGSEVKYFVSLGTASVKVPDVAGMSQADARAALEKESLGISSVETVDDPDVEKDMVVGTDPESGQAVPRNSQVRLIISSGNVTVPDCREMTDNDCSTMIQGAGLLVGERSSQETTDFGDGQVISTNPPADTKVARGSRVDMVVARSPERATVPAGLEGLTLSQARNILTSQRFEVLVSNASGWQDDWTVVGVEPASGTQGFVGDTVILTLQAPPPPPPTTPPPAGPTASPTP